MPNPVIASRVCAEIAGDVTPSSLAAMTPPRKIPATKARFHAVVPFQSYLKNSTFPGTTAAHNARRLPDTPSCLLPIKSSAGTKSPMSGPATYQGQGWLSHCSITSLLQWKFRGIEFRRSGRMPQS